MAFGSPEVIKNPMFNNTKNYTKKINLSKYKYSKTLYFFKIGLKKNARFNSVGILSALCRCIC